MRSVVCRLRGGLGAGGSTITPSRNVQAPPGALIIASDRIGLGIVRSLGRRKIPTWVLKHENTLATFSKYTTHSAPWPDGSDEERLAYLFRLADQHGLAGWTIYGTPDREATFIGRNRDPLAERFRVASPPWDMMQVSYDKRRAYELGCQVQVDVPWTRWPSNLSEVADLDCPFPVIVKPAVKDFVNALTLDKAWLATDRDSLTQGFREAFSFMKPGDVLVQELIPMGSEVQYSFAGLAVDGAVRASVVGRENRQYPFQFGRFSTHVETVHEPQVEVFSHRLLKALRYTGIAEIEFKRDPRDGRYKLLDFNGRIWGWHTLAMRAGVDFPYLLWQLAHGESIPEVRGELGVRWVRLLADLPVGVREITAGRLSVRRYLESLRPPIQESVFAWDDPLPLLLDAPLSAWMTFKDRYMHSGETT